MKALLRVVVLSTPSSLRPLEGFFKKISIAAAKRRLLRRARKRFTVIEPCSGRNWEDSFTTERGALMLWYNTPDGNTHVEREAV